MKHKISLKELKVILRSKKGFTLIELMVVVLLMVLIIIMAYSFFNSSNNFFDENNKRSDAQNQCRKIFEAMQKEVGTAASVQIIGTGNPFGITFPTGTGYVAYFVDNKIFCMMDKNKVTQPAIGYVPLDSFSVSYTWIDTKTLKINISANSDFDLETTIFSRNVDITRSAGTLTTGNVLLIKPAT